MPNSGSGNIYLPQSAVIEKIIVENAQIKTFELAFRDAEYNRLFTYQPGQFMMLSVPHCGEAPISLSSTPTRPGRLFLSIRKAGRLTAAMHDLEVGAVVGLRGPYGRPFPVEELGGRDLLFLAGGIGLAPLRAVINYCQDRPGAYGRKIILYGCRSRAELAFLGDFEIWQQQAGFTCLLTVDTPDPAWPGRVGVVTALLDGLDLDIDNCTALVCGPPVMIRFAMAELSRRGFADRHIITTMERHMKCGVGVCQHCHMADKLVCKDGPVFSRAELLGLEIMELMA